MGGDGASVVTGESWEKVYDVSRADDLAITTRNCGDYELNVSSELRSTYRTCNTYP